MTPEQVLDALRSGDIASIRAAADDDFRSNVSTDQLTQVWASVLDQLGSLVSAGDAVVLHDVPLSFSDGQAHLQVTYSSGAISGLVLRPGPPTARFGD